MARLASLTTRISALVHESARGDEIERLCHVYFLAGHMAAAAIGLIVLLLDLTLAGVPAFSHAFAYSGLVMVLVAVRQVSLNGDLRRGLIWSSLTILTTSVLVSLQGGMSLPATYAWIIVSILEASFIASSQWMKVVAICACISALLIGVMQGQGWIHAPAHAPGVWEALLLLPAVMAACSLCLLALQISRIRVRRSALQNGQFATLCDAMDDLVLRLDRSGAVLSASRDQSEALGLSIGEIMGRGLFERVHVADRPAFLRLVSDALGSPNALSVQIRLRAGAIKHESAAFEAPIFIWVELRALRLNSAQTEDNTEVLMILRDVTLLKELEIELAKARSQTEGSSVWKDQFLACVSHELRTPLNAIIGFSEILGDDALVPKDRAKIVEYANIIQSSGEHLLSVVNSILDVSKLQAGRFEITPETFALPPLIDQCFDIVSLKAQSKQIRMEKDIALRIEEIVADKRACKQILLNLLSNAVKFTPDHGHVKLSLRQEGNSVLIMVSDTGIGIAPQDMSNLGNPFFQVQNNYDRAYEGTGLGLSVVRGLVGLHGGSIALESKLGEGACFILRLPLDCRRVATTDKIAQIETYALHSSAPLSNVSLMPLEKKIA
mgnify:FL=1